jgi:serine/threonine protein kinase
MNVIHRDLKPGVLDEYQRPKITDFGLAFTKNVSVTSSVRGIEAGTPAFMV